MSTALVAVPPATLARAAIAQHSKSFALASRLLPRHTRDATAIVYAWCRRTDDLVDDGGAPADAIAALRTELAAAYAGTAREPVLAAFGAVARARDIPVTYPEALIAGMAMDVAGARYATVDQVIVYAYRVAGVVGLMMSHVFGVADDDALVAAAHLGIAMQLTNICRDVVEDWDRGRLYIPDELLARHGAPRLARSLGRPLPEPAHAALAASVADLLALAGRYYRSGEQGIRSLPWRPALAVRAARDIYAAIGTRIARVDHDVTVGRAVVPRSTKLALAAAAVARIAASAPRRMVTRRRYAIPRRTLEVADVPRL